MLGSLAALRGGTYADVATKSACAAGSLWLRYGPAGCPPAESPTGGPVDRTLSSDPCSTSSAPLPPPGAVSAAPSEGVLASRTFGSVNSSAPRRAEPRLPDGHPLRRALHGWRGSGPYLHGVLHGSGAGLGRVDAAELRGGGSHGVVGQRGQSFLAYVVMKRFGMTPDGELPEDKEKRERAEEVGEAPASHELGDYPGKGDGTGFVQQMGTSLEDDDEADDLVGTQVDPVDVQTAVRDGFKALGIGLLVGIPLALAMAATVVGVAMTMASGQVEARRDGIRVSLAGLQSAGTKEEQLRYELEVLHQLPQSPELDLRIRRVEQELKLIDEMSSAAAPSVA